MVVSQLIIRPIKGKYKLYNKGFVVVCRYVCPPGMEADHVPEGAAAAAAVGAITADDVEMKAEEKVHNTGIHAV